MTHALFSLLSPIPIPLDQAPIPSIDALARTSAVRIFAPVTSVETSCQWPERNSESSAALDPIHQTHRFGEQGFVARRSSGFDDTVQGPLCRGPLAQALEHALGATRVQLRIAREPELLVTAQAARFGIRPASGDRRIAALHRDRNADRVAAECRARDAHCAGQRSLARRRAWPQCVEDLVLRDRPIAMLEQKEEQTQDFGLHPHGLAPAPELETVRVDDALPETKMLSQSYDPGKDRGVRAPWPLGARKPTFRNKENGPWSSISC